MARIVLGLGTSHSPQLSTPPEIWPLHAERDKASTELYRSDGREATYGELLTAAPESVRDELTPEKWQTRYDACQRAIAKEAETVAKVAPDVLIMIGDDQHEIIMNWEERSGPQSIAGTLMLALGSSPRD
jgi:3-O-methylgallate 3,4-dioxygenase